jgi:creatinine amidohydrolase/Fe(II)-dependent formamide hydrolase-like protein
MILPSLSKPAVALALLIASPAAAQSVFLEELTSPEVEARIEKGATTAIVPTGGIEQNGPHMALGKHDAIVRFTAGEIAKELKTALVAPVIAYAPESEHMGHAGTLDVPERVFELVLEHAARSLKAHGFALICFIGDSGGSQDSQKRVAERLDRGWRDDQVRVLHVSDYYANARQALWLKDRGWGGAQVGLHAGLRDTSELLAVAPGMVRRDKLRAHLGKELGPDGVNGDPTKATAELGQELLRIKIDAAVRQIRAVQKKR